jgi:hypothetical protein
MIFNNSLSVSACFLYSLVYILFKKTRNKKEGVVGSRNPDGQNHCRIILPLRNAPIVLSLSHADNPAKPNSPFLGVLARRTVAILNNEMLK